MRVLLVADVVGGVRTFVRELVGGMGARGVELDLALIGPGRPEDFEPLGARSCEVRDLCLEWMENPWRDVEETSRWVEELRARHEPDLIHMNTFAPVRCEAVPVLLTVHSCVLTWWSAVRGAEAPASWNRYRRAAHRALDRANLVAAPTQALLSDLMAVYGPRARGCVISNGRTLGAVPAARREPLVLSVGRIWDEAKNAAALARAATAIEGPVALIGEGAVEGLHSLGPLGEEELLGWLRRASVFAEPARYEPFGFAALEAALCGCALVLGDIPSLREVWGDAASYVSPDDPDELAAEINSLLRDPERRLKAARDANAVAQRLTADAMAARYLDAYRQLVDLAVAA